MQGIDVVPSRKLGPFEIGMILGDCLEILLDQAAEYPHVAVKYNPMRPLGTDIALDIEQRGLLLRFEPREQRLRQVEVYGPQLIGALSYRGHVFCQPHDPATFHKVCSRFGPAPPGEYCPTKKVYKLRYPGISFYFPIPDEFAQFYTSAHDFIATEFPGGQSPVASRIILYYGGDPIQELFYLPPLPADAYYLEEVLVVVGRGVFLSKRNKAITYLSSVQDVVGAIGPPEAVFYKDEDCMPTHAALGSLAAPSASTVGAADYFYNYFSMGIDILFDQHTHYVKKICLRSNFPSHFDFNQYRKCNFLVQGLAPVPLGPPPRVRPDDPDRYPDADVQERLQRIAQLQSVTAISSELSWSDAACFFPTLTTPNIDYRGSNANPFGTIRYYAFKDIVFEVMRNDHIASIVLFFSDAQ